ncbi:MAG: hypothetical protein AAF543_06180 [Pseudomonadota bacterium]
MIASLLLVLLITFLATWWARQLAMHRHRHVKGWMWATVMFPPAVLVLWVLPARHSPAPSA